MRGVNDEQVADLLEWCLERGYELRFIEQMPLDAQHAWERTAMVTAEEILERLAARFDLDAAAGPRAGQRPGRDLAGQRRPGQGRRHRQRQPAVLWRV